LEISKNRHIELDSVSHISKYEIAVQARNDKIGFLEMLLFIASLFGYNAKTIVCISKNIGIDKKC